MTVNCNLLKSKISTSMEKRTPSKCEWLAMTSRQMSDRALNKNYVFQNFRRKEKSIRTKIPCIGVFVLSLPGDSEVKLLKGKVRCLRFCWGTFGYWRSENPAICDVSRPSWRRRLGRRVLGGAGSGGSSRVRYHVSSAAPPEPARVI